MEKEKLKVGDIVYVDEVSISGRKLPEEWRGKIVEIVGNEAWVEDDEELSAYSGERFKKPLNSLHRRTENL